MNLQEETSSTSSFVSDNTSSQQLFGNGSSEINLQSSTSPSSSSTFPINVKNQGGNSATKNNIIHGAVSRDFFAMATKADTDQGSQQNFQATEAAIVPASGEVSSAGTALDSAKGDNAAATGDAIVTATPATQFEGGATLQTSNVLLAQLSTEDMRNLSLLQVKQYIRSTIGKEPTGDETEIRSQLKHLVGVEKGWLKPTASGNVVASCPSASSSSSDAVGDAGNTASVAAKTLPRQLFVGSKYSGGTQALASSSPSPSPSVASSLTSTSTTTASSSTSFSTTNAKPGGLLGLGASGAPSTSQSSAIAAQTFKPSPGTPLHAGSRANPFKRPSTTPTNQSWQTSTPSRPPATPLSLYMTADTPLVVRTSSRQSASSKYSSGYQYSVQDLRALAACTPEMVSEAKRIHAQSKRNREQQLEWIEDIFTKISSLDQELAFDEAFKQRRLEKMQRVHERLKHLTEGL